MKGLVLCVALTVTPVSALAMDDLQFMMVAGNITQILGSEKICGLTYDPAAVAEWIKATVPPERAGQLLLGYAQKSVEMQMNGASDTVRAAHCASMQQAAIHFGLVK